MKCCSTATCAAHVLTCFILSQASFVDAFIPFFSLFLHLYKLITTFILQDFLMTQINAVMS